MEGSIYSKIGKGGMEYGNGIWEWMEGRTRL